MYMVTQPKVQTPIHLIHNYLKTHKPFLLALVVILPIIVIYFVLVDKVKQNYTNLKYLDTYISVFNIVFTIASVLGFLYIFYRSSSKEKLNVQQKQSKVGTFFHSLKKIGMIALPVALASLILYLVFQNKFVSIGTSFVFIAVLSTMLLTVIYRNIKDASWFKNLKNSNYLGMFVNVLFILPCLLLDGVVDIYDNTIDTKKYVYYILLAEILIIAIYFGIPYVIHYLSNHDSIKLLKNPTYTNELQVLGTYENLHEGGKNEQLNYNYSVSSWIFLHNQPASKEGFTSILNYGGKPNIQYDFTTNIFKVTMKNGLNGEKIIYETKNIPLQRWNNIVVNYLGGTIDVFLNGKLVGTTTNVVPYMEGDEITIGENSGGSGGICNVVYHHSPLSPYLIGQNYNIFKNLNPPLL